MFRCTEIQERSQGQENDALFPGLAFTALFQKKFLLPEYKMSTQRVRANTRDGCSFFVNINTTVSIADFFQESGAQVALLPAGVSNSSNAVGTVLLRDMGKTIVVPGSGKGSIPRRLRKVQVVAAGNAVRGEAGFGVAYIELGNRTGGPDGITSNANVLQWASINLPAYS
jgi:hypothetical protein